MRVFLIFAFLTAVSSPVFAATAADLTGDWAIDAPESAKAIAAAKKAHNTDEVSRINDHLKRKVALHIDGKQTLSWDDTRSDNTHDIQKEDYKVTSVSGDTIVVDTIDSLKNPSHYVIKIEGQILRLTDKGHTLAFHKL